MERTLLNREQKEKTKNLSYYVNEHKDRKMSKIVVLWADPQLKKIFVQ